MALDEIVQLIGPWKALHVTFVEKARRQWGVRARGSSANRAARQWAQSTRLRRQLRRR